MEGMFEINGRVPTPREWSMLNCLAVGMTNKEIADRLHLSYGTVKLYMVNLYQKFKVNRYTVLSVLIRDHQRKQAIRLDRWMQQWGPFIPEASHGELRDIIVDQVMTYRPNIELVPLPKRMKFTA